VLLVGGLLLSEAAGLVPHVSVIQPPSPAYRDPWALGSALGLFAFTAYALAYVATSITSRLRHVRRGGGAVAGLDRGQAELHAAFEGLQQRRWPRPGPRKVSHELRAPQAPCGACTPRS